MSKYVMQQALDTLIGLWDEELNYSENKHDDAIKLLKSELAKPDATAYFTDSEDGVYVHMICGGIHLGINLSELDGFADNFIRAYRSNHETT